uniref:RHS repeat-associated core domain-containing protein n=1 Tax=Streptococcus minor TaxID=229549 RepID=UPI000686DF00
GLDYLRARYYDHQVGTFLTEDSYQGDDRDPLSQNLYSYVQNNPVNYTDPSGHRAMGLLGGGGRRVINTRNQRKYSQMRVDPALYGNHSHSGGGYYSAANHIRHRVQSNPSYRPPASYYAAFGPHAAVYRPSPSYVGGYDGVGWQGNYRGQSPDTRAGGKYNDNEGYLPNFDNSGNKITYREFDINSKVADSGRDAERFVRGSDGSIYYTDKHYKSFIKVK